MIKKPLRKPSKASGSDPATTPSPISLVLIDDNRLLREGLAALIHNQPGFQVLAASADVAEALQKVRESQPNIILLDFGLEDHDSLGLTTTLRRTLPGARIIIMGLTAAHQDVADYVRGGASAFIMKDASFEELFATIRAVARGEEVLPNALTNTLFHQLASRTESRPTVRYMESVRLTARERQVIALLSEGLSNKEIGTRLHIAVHTVKSHVHNVLEKLALRSRLEVAAFTHSSGAPRRP